MPESDAARQYPEVTAQPSYPALEEKILAFWFEDGTFEESIARRKASPEYTFNDGPPFANGLPHYGHLLTGFVKDAVPRYQTMQGRHVERHFGWDCHGLPAETEAEKELGVSGRGAITAFGIDKFNDYCRTSVLRYTQAWERYVSRQARWVDFVDDYKTMDLDYMESVLWAFKSLHERGLIYEAFRVLPFCWECETPLSNSETRLDDAYRDRIDPAVTVLFALEADPADDALGGGPVHLAAWTTTPWTLPSNLALAVGPDITYAAVPYDGRTILIAEDRLGAYADELGEVEPIARVRGADLVGRHYRPLFSYFADHPRAFRVLAADFVTTDDGTGVVHLAPGFGEDDQRVCEENGIAVVCPVDERGRFTDAVPDYVNIQVFAANPEIIEHLRAEGVLVREERYEHSYPHCWRTETPLIYKAVSSYFVAVTQVKDRLIELNQEITWTPAHVRDGAFGKWLEGARDWSITRNRFWGSPIPVWKSDDPAYPRIDVYGSIAELEADFGTEVTDLHRPAIDQLTRPNPDDPTGQSTMRRVTDVLDCWFESGAMPFAQFHYPFEGADKLDAHLPADFIVEYIGQTRAWFYYQHVLAGALFDRPAFRNCIAHGVVLGDDGRKLSKRLRNYPDPEQVFADSGADAMRWYLLSSAVLRGQDVVIEEHAMADPVRQVLNPIWNTWVFLSLYGRIDEMSGTIRTDQTGLLDRYILAATRELVDNVTGALDRYELADAAGAVSGFLDALTNWYVRRSRERFWRPGDVEGDGDTDKRDAYDTLHTVLETLCRVIAPLLPYLSEAIYRDLTGARSVHLTDWPDAELLPAAPELVSDMALVREVCSLAHSIRKQQGLRARLPLARLTIAGPPAERLAPYLELIADEVNVKEVVLELDATGLAATRLSVIPAVAGPRLADAIQIVLRAVRAGEWSEEDGTVIVAGHVLQEDEYSLRLVPADEATARVLESAHGVVVLDTALTAELEAEGTARDLVRIVQQARKDADLNVSDRIELFLEVPAALVPTVEAHAETIAQQVLATELTVGILEGDGAYGLPDGHRVNVTLRALPQTR
jgi:isoleucyl-tRNA synthetase